ncbi:MAG TPA: maleylpyruvate isomerase family mycothiol-dependent enzyme [Actinomycetota bacterium]|nr:maleylpyruvate isomerase family mycothiol-dependent enzyme [Actinomycetota bacterium]
MSLERDQLLGVAHAERQRLGRMVQYADPETWEQPSAAAGWWNRDVMAHLAASDTAAAQLIAGEAATELDEYREQLGDEPFAVDRWNAWTVSRRGEIATREILDTWGRAADAFLAYAARLSVDEWRDARFRWLAGEIAARYLVQSRVVEWFLHGEDMRATNGVADGWQAGWQHWPVHLTIDMGIRMLPWALAERGYDLAGSSVQVHVEGAGQGEWHWGLGAGEVPPADKKPDATIVGRAPQLALVAGRRLPADAVLDSGLIVVGGDASLGELILRTIRAYP